MSGEPVVACENAAEVLETAEGILNAMPLFMGSLVEAERLEAVGSVGDDRCRAHRVIVDRNISIAGARDPIFIDQIDESLARVIAGTRACFKEVPEEAYRIASHLYGRTA